jgi:hypothetical protein
MVRPKVHLLALACSRKVVNAVREEDNGTQFVSELEWSRL